MISKRISDFAYNQRDLLSAYLAIIMGVGIGGLGCIAFNKVINDRILKTCNTNLNQIVYMKTAVGDSYGCISKMVLSGPPAPIKP